MCLCLVPNLSIDYDLYKNWRRFEIEVILESRLKNTSTVCKLVTAFVVIKD